MASQSLFQSGDQRQMLFAQRREIASNAAKGLSPRQAAKVSRDFLLHFDHPDIALGLTIVERYPEIVQEAQHLVLIVEQAIQEIASGTLWFSTAPGRSGVGLSREVLMSGEQDALIAGSPLLQGVWRQAALASGTGGLHGGLHLQEHGFHLSGPRLTQDLFDKGQLAQMMHIAQGVQALVALITGQAIVVGSDRGANDAAGSVAAQDVGRCDLPLLALRINYGRLYAVVVLLQGVQRPAQAEVACFQVGDRLAQHLLNQRLGDLLPRFREYIASLR